jgi:RNA polymerase sigma-70 factor (ECF subfamily)
VNASGDPVGGQHHVRQAAVNAFRNQDWATLDDITDRLAAEDQRELLIEIVGLLHLARPAVARMLVSEADIDDAEQATLVKLYTKLHSFDGRSRFRTWLHALATNEARMLLRHQASRPSVPIADELEGWFALTMRHSSLVADRTDLAQAIRDLDEPYRSAVLLRDVEGLDYREIATRLGCAVGTVSSRVARGRSMLLAKLQRKT